MSHATVLQHHPQQEAKLNQILSQQQRYQKQLLHQERQQQSCSQSAEGSEQDSLTLCSVESTHEHSERCRRDVWAKPADQSVLSQSVTNPHPGHASDLIVQDLSYDCDSRSSVSLLESESVYLPFDVPASPVILHHPTLTQERQSYFSSKSNTVITAANTHPSHMCTDRSEKKYNSLERRPICPLNQLLGKDINKPVPDVTRPVTSSSEPSVGSQKSNVLMTAQSEDYESGSEQTASESDSVPVTLLKSHALQKPVTSGCDNNNKSAPEDKLRHIKFVAGNKKVASHSVIDIQEKAKTTSRIRGGGNFIMKTLFSTKTTVDTPPTVSSSSSLAQAPVTVRTIEEGASGLLRNSPQVDRCVHVETRDSKLMKGKLNQERMDHKKSLALSRVNKAATKIQACWRGYRTRHFNAQVISIHKEIRARRAEDHILLLRQDLERNRKLYEEEKQLRILQMEAIRLLYKEVQELKSQSLSSCKDLSSGDRVSASTVSSVSPMLATSSPASAGTSGCNELNRTQELERTCASLQSQVSQLQETLQSVSTAVFKTNNSNISDFDIADQRGEVRVTPVSGSLLRKSYKSDETSHWGCIPHSLSPYPSEEEDLYFLQVSVPGAPTPPRHLQLRHYNHQALLLSWQPPSCHGQNWEEEGNKHIIGYRVYVNDQLKAFVCQRTSALVEGLDPLMTYKFYVKALSGLGESFESNIIMAKLAKGEERSKFAVNSGTDSSQDSDKDVDSKDSKEKLRMKNRKMHKSPRSVEKLKGPKISHRRYHEAMSELGDDTSSVMSSNNNNNNNNLVIDNKVLAILTHPKLHTHRRHHSHDRHSTESKDSASENTSQESSPSAGTSVRVEDQRLQQNASNLQTSSTTSPLLLTFIKSTSSRRMLQFSDCMTQPKGEEEVSETNNRNKPISPGTGCKKESPPSGSVKANSPSRQRRKENPLEFEEQKSSPHVSPACGTGNERKLKTSPRSGTENSPLKMSPSAGSSDINGSQPSSFSQTFTVDKAHSYLEKVNAIAQSVLTDKSLLKHSSHGHRRTRSRDFQQDGVKASVTTGSKLSLEQETDCLSVEEAAQLGIGKHREKQSTSSYNRENHSVNVEGAREKAGTTELVKGHKRTYSKDNDQQTMEESKEEDHKTEAQYHGIPSSNQPIIDGRHRHSSGSRPSSPVVAVGSGERPRMTVAELMMEQKLRSLNKSVSLNSLSSRTEDGSKLENSRRSPSTESLPSSSVGETLQSIVCNDTLAHAGLWKRENSKETHSNKSFTNTVMETKVFHSNESLPGNARSNTSVRSTSNESLSDGIHEEVEKNTVSQTDKKLNNQSSESKNQVTTSCKRSWSMGSAQDLGNKTNRDTHSSRTNSLVSKLLLKLENITRHSSAAFREKSDKPSKPDSDEKDIDAAAASKPPSDDERLSGPRSRNLSDSDAEGRTSDPGSQLPPRAPSDGSHSDDNHQSYYRKHRRTPSDHRQRDTNRPTHSPIIMEGGTMKKTSSNMRRNQSFHGLLPSKHQDAKSSPSLNEDTTSKNEDYISNQPSSESQAFTPSQKRSRTPSPSRGRKPVISSAQLKGLSGPDISNKT